MNTKGRLLLHLLAIATVAIWGTTYVVTKILLEAGLNPADIFFYRFLLAYFMIWPLCRKKLFAENRQDELRFLLAGFTGGSLYFLTENTALQLAQASDVSILVSACPIFTSIILAVFYKSERLRPRQIMGILIAFIGVALVVFNGQVMLHLSLLGYTLALSSGFAWALYQLFTKPLVAKYDSWFISRKVFFYGLLTIFPYYFLVEPLNTSYEILSMTKVWGNILGLSLIANVLCYVVWNKVMRGLGAVKSAVYIYLSPAFTIVTAYILLGERITLMAIVGLCILVIGMVMAEKRSTSR